MWFNRKGKEAHDEANSMEDEGYRKTDTVTEMYFTDPDTAPSYIEPLGETQTKISGYRELSQEDKELINQIKELENNLGIFIRDNVEWRTGIHLTTDHHWVNIAKTDLQKGFMALVRSVAQPESEL